MPEYRFSANGVEHTVALEQVDKKNYRANIEDREVIVSLDSHHNGSLDYRINGRCYRCDYHSDGDNRMIGYRGGSFTLTRTDHKSGADSRSHSHAEAAADPEIRAPMPGKIIKVLVAIGDAVEKNSLLVVMEAMKMEYSLSAPFSGTVESVRCKQGEQMELGDVLIQLKLVEKEKTAPL